MSETKPEKRLVSKGQYVRVMVKKLGLYSLLVFMLSIGMPCLIGTIFIFAFTGLNVWTMVIGTLTVAMLWLCHLLFVKVSLIEPVTPITVQNAHLLTAQETLLRGSDLPPTIQQAELLRATQAKQETPQEQLLRASATRSCTYDCLDTPEE